MIPLTKDHDNMYSGKENNFWPWNCVLNKLPQSESDEFSWQHLEGKQKDTQAPAAAPRISPRLAGLPRHSPFGAHSGTALALQAQPAAPPGIYI